ncbi:hypothetical protein MA16_Dca027899 [Dendrobium catenatum]|uniref:Uncharacterized protein n=1 Tax=Dendrobium catenatum TaxID=906689 RepID=A0A2I0VGK7_9ASPA|nr:hypothetical protein MA16_Dca027899 [Dendrobium catenatum]
MEQCRLLPSDVWKNCKKNLVIPTLEVFNGNSKVLEGFNQNFKGFNGKPLVINEGGLLGRSELPVLVSGKGNNVIRDEDVNFLKVKSILGGSFKGVDDRCLDCSVSSDLSVSSCKNFDSKSLPSSPIKRYFYGKDLNYKKFPPRKTSVPMKKVFLPKAVASVKENLNSLAVKEDRAKLDEVREDSCLAGNNVELITVEDIPDEGLSLNANQVIDNEVSIAVEINNKFGSLSDLEEGDKVEPVAGIDKGMLEEGEIIESTLEGGVLKEGKSEKQSPLTVLKVDVAKTHSESSLEGNLSLDKKTKLAKELKSLGAGNIIAHNRKGDSGKVKKSGGPSPIFRK